MEVSKHFSFDVSVKWCSKMSNRHDVKIKMSSLKKKLGRYPRIYRLWTSLNSNPSTEREACARVFHKRTNRKFMKKMELNHTFCLRFCERQENYKKNHSVLRLYHKARFSHGNRGSTTQIHFRTDQRKKKLILKKKPQHNNNSLLCIHQPTERDCE